MADVFLSYAREDAARAQQIAEGLEAEGVDVFWDNEIPPGSTWADYIESKLTQCKALIVLWSEHSTKSQWVREEARMGRDKGVLIPVMIDASSPPFGFGELQAANLTDWQGQRDHANWRRFADAVGNFAKAAPRTTAPQAFASAPPRATSALPPPSQPVQTQGRKGLPVWVWVGGAVVATLAVLGVIGSIRPTTQQQAAYSPSVQPAASQQQPVTPQQPDATAQNIILAQLQQASTALGQQGFQMVGQPATGGLSQAQITDIPAQMNQGYDYRVLGVCDRDCGDLDLGLFDANGQLLTQDTSTSSQPFIGAQPSYNGNFVVRATMYNCRVAPCYFAVALYARPMQ
jgi:hypothetical protein